jgi:hypothetical protein
MGTMSDAEFKAAFKRIDRLFTVWIQNLDAAQEAAARRWKIKTDLPAYAIAINILVILSALIYRHDAPPFWLAYPLPPLLAWLLVGLWREMRP